MPEPFVTEKTKRYAGLKFCKHGLNKKYKCLNCEKEALEKKERKKKPDLER